MWNVFRGRRALRRGTVWLITAVLLAGLLSPRALASGATKKETARAIAIAFDNSGSMYSSGNQAWCQATYAMEVFAAMLNSGDVLQVYPMHPIEVGGVAYNKEDSPLTIHGPSEASVIREIYTPTTGGTPMDTITYAHDGLLKLRADERWLIVLTDGDTFDTGGTTLSRSETARRLGEVLTEYGQDVNVMYLGVGSGLTVPTVDSSSYYGTAADSAQVPAELSNMCNRIFGRDTLPSANVVNGQVTFDLPMSKLIVFIQGDGVSNISLSGAGNPVSTYAPEYSTRGRGSGIATPDTSLQGMIATYEDCPAGTYPLNYSGTARSTVLYYEPDVDLQVTVRDEEGQIVTPGGTLYPGTYTIEYGMVDKDGNPTQSSLLGSTSYTIGCKVGGTEQTPVTSAQAGSFQVELEAGESLAMSAEVTFLSGYRIQKSGRDLGWDGSNTVSDRPLGQFSLQLSGGQSSYGLSHLEEQGVYQITASYEGTPITGAALDQVTLDASLTGGNAGYDLTRTEDGYTLRLLYAGSAQDTACGEYTLTVSGTYLNEFEQTVPADPQTAVFTVEDETAELALDLDIPQNYYVISKLAEGKPLEAYLTINGAPLTEEQMAQASLTAQADGLTLIVERIPGQSGYTIRIDPDSKPEKGSYTINVSAAAKDPVGRDITAAASGSVRLDPISKWVYILIILLVLLVIAVLIWLFLNAKVLPKRVRIQKTTFTVDGSAVPGTAGCNYTGGGKKHGSLDINSPKFAANSMVKCGLHLDLEAVSPRRERSASRRMGVRAVSPINGSAVTSIKVGTVQFVKDPATNRFVRPGKKANAPVEFDIGPGASCTVVADVMDSDGGSIAVSLVVKLQNK